MQSTALPIVMMATPDSSRSPMILGVLTVWACCFSRQQAMAFSIHPIASSSSSVVFSNFQQQHLQPLQASRASSGADDVDDDDEDDELVPVRRRNRSRWGGAGAGAGAYYDQEEEDRYAKDDRDVYVNDDEEEEDYEDDNDDDDDDTMDHDDEDFGFFGKGVIPNPLLDSMDPDGAADRFPELAADPRFWFDMLLLVTVLDFLSYVGPREALWDGIQKLPLGDII